MDVANIDTPKALDVAIETQRRAKREVLLGVLNGNGFGVSEALASLVALLALGAILFGAKHLPSEIIAGLMALSTIAQIRFRRKRDAAQALRQMEASR